MPSAISTYLTEHMAGATMGIDLARKLVSDIDGPEASQEMQRLADDIEADRETLGKVIQAEAAPPGAVKRGAAWLGEKLARVRFSPALTGSPELSHLLELEALAMGVYGKRGLWLALQEAQASCPELRNFDFGSLVERAEDQLRRLDALRLDCARSPLSGAPAHHGA